MAYQGHGGGYDEHRQHDLPHQGVSILIAIYERESDSVNRRTVTKTAKQNNLSSMMTPQAPGLAPLAMLTPNTRTACTHPTLARRLRTA